MERALQLLEKFRARFGGLASLARAPGRVNLIGEHTDYNEGFVLPAAIDLFCWVAFAARKDRIVDFYSEHFDESVEASLDDLATRSRRSWVNYPLGVAWALQHAGCALRGANLYISSDVPLGAGLSSSAAIEVATGYALMSVAGAPIDAKKLALLCQRAENEFVGARTGIMDQFISCHARTGHALLLDCRSLDFRHVPLPADVDLVICNTMVRHRIGAGEYNVRRGECEAAARALSTALPRIRTLRDVSLADLEAHRALLSETLYRRCRHVITENARVQETVSALESGHIENLGQLMANSHRSLRDDYEVSCRELDLMVDLAERQGGVLGARMTGGGFGGCTINLVRSAESAEFRKRIAEEYEAAAGRKPEIYVCKTSDGAQMVGDVTSLASS